MITMSENKVVLSLQNVTKKFGKLTVLDDMSLDVHEHEIVVLCGPSGGGKTTISRLAARFYDIDSGKITVGGMDISKIDPEKLLELYNDW